MPQTWEQLYETHGDALVLYARQFVGGIGEAEDIVHDAFVRLFQKRKNRRHPNPKALLFKSVRWTALDYLKSNQRREKRESTAATDLFEHQTIPFPGSENEDFAALISRLLFKLPDDQREVLILHLWGNLTFREIAEQLDISANTAASRYRYGLDHLRADAGEIRAAHPESAPLLTVD